MSLDNTPKLNFVFCYVMKDGYLDTCFFNKTMDDAS